MRCPASSGAQIVLLPVASELSIQFSGGEEGQGERLISSTLTESVITDVEKNGGGGEKSGHCHSRSLSSVSSLYKSHKSKASQNDVAEREKKASKMENATGALN